MAACCETVRAFRRRAKAQIMAALMRKYQPEGGHTALEATTPSYEKDLRGILVYALRIDSITGELKLAQNRAEPALSAIVQALW